MEVATATTASCSCLVYNAFRSNISKNPKNYLHSVTFPYSSSSGSSSVVTCSNLISFSNRGRRGGGLITAASSSVSGDVRDQSSSQELAVLLEVEGVLMDVYRLGNRLAFNLAFQKLGLDCANWSQPVYLDLIRKTGGDEKRMLVLFFDRIGWPTSLPTSEKATFIKSVLREKGKALEEIVMTKSLSLRPGVENFIDDAILGGIPIVILTAYGKHDDKMARSIIEQLGEERVSRIKIVGMEETERSFYGQLAFGKGISSGLDEQLAKEARQAAAAQKQKIAEEVAPMLKVSIELGTSQTESFEKFVATLHAGSEYAGVPVNNCVLIAGGQFGLRAAEHIGMPCVVLRSSLTSRGEFPSANAVMDGFGEPDLTVSKLLRRKQWS